MKDFKNFFKEDEAVEKSLKKLPKRHQKLLDDFDFRFEGGNTLKGDDGHVGMVVTKPKIIVVAAPYNYGREFTLFHEIAHLVYSKFIKNTEYQKEWEKLVPLHKDRKKDEDSEELFCHAYSSHFVKYPPMIHHHPAWDKFIKKICEE